MRYGGRRWQPCVCRGDVKQGCQQCCQQEDLNSIPHSSYAGLNRCKGGLLGSVAKLRVCCGGEECPHWCQSVLLFLCIHNLPKAT